MAASAAPDLVILDLGLPDVPGETVAREVRAAGSTPILMLTAKSSEEDRIAGLELGADDYVTKPFSPRELVLRVQAILRRGAPAAAEQGVSRFGGGRAGHRRAAAARRGPRDRGRADPDRVGDPGRAGHRAGPGVLALRADQPGPRLRVRGLRADRSTRT